MTRHPTDDRAGPAAPVFHFLDAEPPPRLTWLWPQRLPLGALTLLVGDPGIGKSVLAVDLAARLSAARPWPDAPTPLPSREGPRGGSPNTPLPSREGCGGGFPIAPLPSREGHGGGSPNTPLPPREGCGGGYPPPTCDPPQPSDRTARFPAGVVFAAPEDHAALSARLAAAGADLRYISVLDGVRRPFTHDLLPLRLPAHADQLEEAIRAHDRPRLVVLDPIHRLLDDGVCCSPDLQAGLLACLAELADRKSIALLAVGHFTRTTARRVLYRIRGSFSLVAAARSILLLTADPDCPDRRILTQIKNTYGPPAPPLAFRIATPLPLREGPGEGPCLVWDDPARPDWRLATGALDLSPESFSVLSETCAWLTDFLSAGPRPAREVLAAARAAGIPRVTLLRAKRLLNIPSRRHATAWTWLPAHP